MFRKVLIAASVSLIGFSMFGCNSSSSSPTGPTNSNPLVGTWNMTSQVTTHANGSVTTTTITAINSNQYVFKADNTLSETAGGAVIPGTWSSTADSVTITVFGATKCKYSISGKELTLTYGFSVTGDSGTITEKYAKQ